MQTTYLVNKRLPDGTTRLEIATHDEWLSLVTINKQLPFDRRHYFIRDYIADGDDLDCMIIETSAEEYRTWNREHTAAERNRALKRGYQHLSLDSNLFRTDEAESLLDTLATTESVEEQIYEGMLIEDLRKELARWKPWANDMLKMYLTGRKKSCTSALAQKYGVSEQTVRKYKRQFESFINIFLRGVSF